MSTEIRWQSGQEEYTAEEIEHMLQSQRAIIHNDVKGWIALNKDASKEELIDKLYDYLREPRKVQI